MSALRWLRQALQWLAREVVERRVVPWLLAYLAGAWVLTEASAHLTEQFGWPAVIPDLVPVVLAFGVLSAVTVAWYHGRAGWQEVRGREVVVHGLIAAALAATLWTGSWPQPAERAERALPLERIAVLYFKDHTGGELGRLARDLTEGVVHELAQVEPLDVLPLTAVAPYRDTVGLDRVVREVGVGTVVEGSVSRSGDSLRVIAQLVDAVPGTHFGSWDWTVAEEPGVVGRLSVEITNRVRRSLGEQIRQQELEREASSERALVWYHQAHGIYQEEASADWTDDPSAGIVRLGEADSVLAEAIRLDPSWPAPHLLRSLIAEDRSLLTGRLGERSQADLVQGVEHANRALRTGRDSAAALERRGKLRFALAEHSAQRAADTLRAAAERDLREATRLDDRRAEALMALSEVLNRQGKFNAAYQAARRALDADAYLEFGSGVLSSLTRTALQLERLGEAREINDMARRRFPERQVHLMDRLVILASIPRPTDRDIQAAWAAADTLAALGLVERRPEWRAYGHMLVAAPLVRAGLPDSAEAVIRRARARLAELGSELQPAASFQEAHARVLLEQRDSALALLEHYVEGYPGRGASVLSDWWFRPLWDDPRLEAITGTAPLADRN